MPNSVNVETLLSFQHLHPSGVSYVLNTSDFNPPYFQTSHSSVIFKY